MEAISTQFDMVGCGWCGADGADGADGAENRLYMYIYSKRMIAMYGYSEMCIKYP